MIDFGLISICASAFISVFILLSVLAGLMRLLLLVFPVNEVVPEETTGSIDPAVVAAVTSATAAAYPGARVTKIEEKK